MPNLGIVPGLDSVQRPSYRLIGSSTTFRFPMISILKLFLALLLFNVTIPVHSAIVKSGCRRHGTQYVIDEPGCDLVAVNLNMCSGYCMSFSFLYPEKGTITSHGKCCRMVDSEWVKVFVKCLDGDRAMKIPSATECRCFDCA